MVQASPANVAFGRNREVIGIDSDEEAWSDGVDSSEVRHLKIHFSTAVTKYPACVLILGLG